MSADNGIYILRTPAWPIKRGNALINRHNEFEFRVAYACAIDNIDYSDLYLPLIFGNRPVYDNKDDAYLAAVKMSEGIEYLEYGICHLVKDKYFPNMTIEEAKKALDCYVIEVDGALINHRYKPNF